MRRLADEEMAELRQNVTFSYPEPTEAEVIALCRSLELIQRRPVQPSQRRYLIRCWRIHGEDTEPLLRALFAARCTLNNLLLVLEVTPPAWLRPGSDESLEADPEA